MEQPKPYQAVFAKVFRYNKAKHLPLIFTNSEKCSLAAVKSIPDHRWEWEVIEPQDWTDTKFVGVRTIDGELVNVWISYAKKRYLAQKRG